MSDPPPLSLTPAVPPYLSLSITQALSLPEPTGNEPRDHRSVNALIDARATAEAKAEDDAAAASSTQRKDSEGRFAVGFTELDQTTGQWSCNTLTYRQIRILGLTLGHELRARLPAPQPHRSNAKSPNGTSLVAILSPSGVDLFAHILALWRIGFGVLCIAPGSPAEAIANLLRLTETSAILAHASQLEAAQAGVDQVRASQADVIVELVSMDQAVHNLLSSARATTPPPDDNDGDDDGERGPGPDDVLVTMHTSGSSGLPKPIYQPHRFWTQSMTTAAGIELAALTTTPLFHGGMSDFLRSLQAGSTIFFHPSAAPGALTATAIANAADACPQRISYFLSVPYILEMLYTDRRGTGRDFLRPMQLVSTGGAPLPQALGDAMVDDRIRLVSRLGSSECGFLMSSWRDFDADKEWSYLRVPDERGHRLLHFEPAGGDSFELVVDPSWPVKLVSNRADGSYATSDLYQPHPSKPHTWRYAARSDDTLVLISGKKTTAPQLEAQLRASDLVAEAIAFGTNRAIVGVLVFLKASVEESEGDLTLSVKQAALVALKPTVEAYNRTAPPHAQLAIEMVHLLPSSALSDIPRASKGSLQRGRAYQQYEPLIAQIYRDFEEGQSISLDAGGGGGSGSDSDRGRRALAGEELVTWLIETIVRLRGRGDDAAADSDSRQRKEKPISGDTDLFVAGIDSIQAARIRAVIHQNIALDGRLLQKNVVYDYPTPRLLAEHVEETGRHGGQPAPDEEMSRQDDEKQHRLMLDLVERHARFDEASADGDHAQPDTDGAAVEGRELYVLTGVTGALGAHLFDQLRQRTDGQRFQPLIVCLVRADDDDGRARQRVVASLEARRLHESVAWVKGKGCSDDFVCLAADLSSSFPCCGLPEDRLGRLYGRFRRVVTIHAAWAVNFVGSLQSFECEQIAGLSNLIRLHRRLVGSDGGVRSRSHFSFCSSVASVLGCPPSLACNTAVPSIDDGKSYSETLSSWPVTAAAMGYARSKWVAEHICSRYRRQTGEGASVMRIGQLCSDTAHGIWNETEGWPLLVRTADEVGCLPELKGEKLAWLPVDAAAGSILDVVAVEEDKGKEEVSIYHIVADDRKAEEWGALLGWLGRVMRFERVEPRRWLERLEEEERTKSRGMIELWRRNYTSKPGNTESEETGGTARLDTTQSLSTSRSLREAATVSESLVAKSVEAWRESGFLRPRASSSSPSS